MSLLFDENVSWRLVDLLKTEYPGSSHVEHLALRGAQDTTIWDLAKARNLALVTKDDDFRSLALLHGFPPKVIWLRVGGVSQRCERIAAGPKPVGQFLSSSRPSCPAA